MTGTEENDFHIYKPKAPAPPLFPGDPAPWFVSRSTGSERYNFDTTGGRYLILSFFGSVRSPHGQAVMRMIRNHRALFDDTNYAFFGVSVDPADEALKLLTDLIPGVRNFWDFEGKISALYGATDGPIVPGESVRMRPLWFVLDPNMRVRAVMPLTGRDEDAERFIAYLKSLPPVNRFAGTELMAPVLFLPRVFEPAFCQSLIDLYHTSGGVDSGFMRDVGGRTVAITDYRHKRRRDHMIDDEELQLAIQRRIMRRIVPEIKKAFQFETTRIERYVVACYRAEDEAHFGAHRDNTTKGTAHRRFAVTINLNDAFEGGELSFPEYGSRRFRPPPGGAVVFSCSLLHEVSTVTKGERFCFLPFLYDNAAKEIRDENQRYLEEDNGGELIP